MNSVKDVLKNPWVKLVGLVLALGLFGWAVYVVRDVLIPFALALIVAYILDPVVDTLERRKIPRTLAIALLTMGLFVAVAGGGLLLVLDIQAAVGGSVEPEPQQVEPEEASRDQAGDNEPVGDDEELPTVAGPAEGQTTKEWIKGELSKVVAYLPQRFRPLAERAANALYDYLAPRLQGIAQSAGSVLAQAATSAWGFVVWIFNLALFLVVTLYLLMDIDKLKGKCIALVPERHKPNVLRIARDIDVDLRSFFRGQLLVSLSLTVIYLIGLLIAGVPYALPIAIIGGLGNFVPYLGTFLGLFSGLVASVTFYGIDIHLLYVVIVFAIGQALEGNIITPKIVGKSVGLSPVAIIFSVLVFGKLLGLFGVLFAVPIASTLRVFARELLPRLGLEVPPVAEGPQPLAAAEEETEDALPNE